MIKEKNKEEGLIKEREEGSPICGKWEWNGWDGRGCELELDSNQGRPLVQYLGTLAIDTGRKGEEEEGNYALPRTSMCPQRDTHMHGQRKNRRYNQANDSFVWLFLICSGIAIEDKEGV